MLPSSDKSINTTGWYYSISWCYLRKIKASIQQVDIIGDTKDVVWFNRYPEVHVVSIFAGTIKRYLLLINSSKQYCSYLRDENKIRSHSYPISTNPFRFIVFVFPKKKPFKIICFQSFWLRVPDDGYSRNTSCALNKISTYFFFTNKQWTMEV